MLVLALLLAGGYVAAYAAAGDKVPRGTTVAGVPIGGKTPAEAQQALEAGLAERVDELVLVAVGSDSRELSPSELGLSVDYAASVSEAGGERTWDPQRLWNYYTGGEDLDPVVELDEARLEAVLDDLDAAYGSKAKNGAISFDTGRAVVTEPEVGQALDREGVAEALLGAWLADDEQATVALGPRRHRPRHRLRRRPGGDGHLRQPGAVGTGDAGLRRLAGPAEPPRLRARPPPRSRSTASWCPRLKKKAIVALVDAGITTEAPVDATVALVNGKPKVDPGQARRQLRAGASSPTRSSASCSSPRAHARSTSRPPSPSPSSRPRTPRR